MNRLHIAAASALSAAVLAHPAPSSAAEIQFNRDVRPILSEYCFQCHGNDAKARKAKLRLDTRDGLFTKRKRLAPFQPGRPERSEAIRRVSSADPDVHMPPPESKRTLSAAQIGVLRDWVRQGARWQKHWAFQKPVRPAIPKVKGADWPRNAIDHFVLARLERENLAPSPAASPRRLLRRATLDLTGIPPTPEEIAAFEADRSPRAYERVVDRLLASPRYGERMAWDWLDAARYADTNGYQGDKTRTMWPLRDWVVDALNRNLPYDQFVIWQLAGDRLPNATFEQKLATGFCRNHMINGEGGRIAEENRVEYIFDQVEMVGTIWLGLTLTCSRCHDHKFDPIKQRNYYQLFDYFNQTPVTGGGGNPQTPPVLTVPDKKAQKRIAVLEKRIVQWDGEIAGRAAQLAGGQRAWEQQARENQRRDPWTVLVPTAAKSSAGQTMTIQDDRSILVGGRNPAKDTYTVTLSLPAGRITGLRLDALRHETMTKGGLARSDSSNFVLTEIELARALPGEDTPKPIKIASARATYEQGGFKIKGTFDNNRNTGWAVHKGGFVKENHAAVFRFAQPVTGKESATLTVRLRHDSRHKSHNIGRFRLSVTEESEPRLTGGATALKTALRVPAEKRTKDQVKIVAEAYHRTDETYRKIRAEREKARAEIDKLQKASGPKVMVMKDMPKRRKTYVLYKGLYNQRREEVTAGVPEILPPLPPGAPADRLGLARWLVDPENPLTSRVTINRHWRKFFGVGLVKTVEDFGSQGAKPSHPELLDWLATEFIRTKWDVKAMHRLLVTSATYRQTAKTAAVMFERDPENRLLARGPRYRLPSWMIRDQALAVSGLLVERLGGPPVKPYQPKGIWAEQTFGKIRYKQDSGEKLHRRSLYTFWRRIVAPTMFFDTASRQTCTVKTARTNTPLHALLTLNDVTYVEAARAMAQRVMEQAGPTPEARIALAFTLATSRRPTDAETAVLRGRLDALKRQYASQPLEARKLLQVGQRPHNEKLDAVEHAAWTGICSLILNLDETLNN